MVEKMPTPYDTIGEETLNHLIHAFYRRVGKHPNLAPIFPDDLTETARKQKQFMTQFLGGPPLYTDEHGHPMLRARHMPFEITQTRAKDGYNVWKMPWMKSVYQVQYETFIFQD